MRFLMQVAMMNWVILRRIIRAMEEGKPDEYGLSRIFVEHRMRTERDARIEGVQLGLTTAVQLIRIAATSAKYGNLYGSSLPDIEAVLQTVSPEDIIDGNSSAMILSRGEMPVARFA